MFRDGDDMLPTQTPFGFMVVLGAMSLVGMQIKNAIVLVDEINLNKTRGLSDYESVVQAGVSRVRPVVLAARTTVLGVIPLIQDVFWISMAMIIMAGLTFGTLVAMVLTPILYAAFYGIPSPKRGSRRTRLCWMALEQDQRRRRRRRGCLQAQRC